MLVIRLHLSTCTLQQLLKRNPSCEKNIYRTKTEKSAELMNKLSHKKASRQAHLISLDDRSSKTSQTFRPKPAGISRVDI